MASPVHITTKNLSGTWTINKTLGDPLDRVLALQGVGWLTRKAIGLSPITQEIKQYTDESGMEHIDVESILPGGLKSVECRILDDSEQHEKDDLFGYIVRRSKRVKRSELTHEYMKGNCHEAEAEEDGVLQMTVRSDTAKTKTTWVLEQVWGFEELDGVRYSTERIHFVGPKGETIEGRLVYNLVKST
ncbi:hypothetical protein JB92DRAFT_3038955 [Gautieria morchelliformis]|nr:hypothetical protein JB92DRAFT_3038955 [Gautieria morchelliformis]